MSIRLKLEGFDDMMRAIEKAGGSIERASKKALSEGAQVMENELKAQMARANVPSDLISAMPAYSIETKDGLIIARVGYRKGAYNPKALSDGYKVLFLNYGTPNRSEHGQVKPRSFIQRAKRIAKPKIVKAEKNALEEILRGL